MSKALINAQAKTKDRMDEIMAQVETSETGEFTEEQKAEFDKLEAQFKRQDEAIAAYKRNQEIERNMGTVADPLSPATPAAGVVTGGKPVIESDPKRGFARGVGEFATAVMNAMTPGKVSNDPRLQFLATATGMNQAVGSEGGFLVPPQFSQTIYEGLQSAGENILGRTDTYTVTGESLTFPANAETSRANGSRWGGVRGYWIAEAAQIASSKPTLRQVRVEPQQLAVLTYVTDKLLANAVALEQYITRAAVSEINFLIGDAFFNGTGAGQPVGVIGHAATVSVAKETGQAAATLVSANINKMWSRLHAAARQNAVWFTNQDVEPQLHELNITVGTGGLPAYLPPGGLSDAPYATLKGRPVIPVEWCATLGTVGDVVLCDPKAYVMGVRGGIDSAMSMHLRFDYAETAFRWMYACDGQPWLASAINPYKGTNTLSPVVTLATRA